MEETTDIAVEHDRHWDVAVTACHACTAKASRAKQFKEGVPPGVLFSVTRSGVEPPTAEEFNA